MGLSGRVPSRRAVAAIAKLCGRRLTRRWPFLSRTDGENTNLEFDDLLELQYARSRKFVALVNGAIDAKQTIRQANSFNSGTVRQYC